MSRGDITKIKKEGIKPSKSKTNNKENNDKKEKLNHAGN
jgi:hypothetical protein